MSDGFIFFESFWEAAKELSAKERLKFYDTVIQYAFTGEAPDFHGTAKSAFLLVKPIIDSTRRKQAAGRKAGEASGAARRAKKERTNDERTANETRTNDERMANEPRTDKDKDKEKDKDKDIEREMDKDIDTPPINISPSKRGTKFIPPTVEEVRQYVEEKGYHVDPEAFVNFYESKGWVVGKTKMKNWKAAVNTWERNRDNRPRGKSGSSGNAYIDAINNRMDVVKDWLS